MWSTQQEAYCQQLAITVLDSMKLIQFTVTLTGSRVWRQRVCLQMGTLNLCCNWWRAAHSFLTACEGILLLGSCSGSGAAPLSCLCSFCCLLGRAARFIVMGAACLAFLQVLPYCCMLEGLSWVLQLRQCRGEEEQSEIREGMERRRTLIVKCKGVLCQSLPVLQKQQ